MTRRIQVRLIMQLHDSGMSQDAIASSRHMSKSSISKVLAIARKKNITYADKETEPVLPAQETEEEPETAYVEQETETPYNLKLHGLTAEILTSYMVGRDVTLQQLRYFRELAANGHLTHTAEKLHITQTSLSNTIIHLEKELGVRLFRRVGRSLELSEIGEAYLRYVEEGLSSLDNGLTVVDDYLNRGNNSVSIAMSSSHVWTTLIRNFRTEYRDYSIRQVNCTRLQYRDLLISQETDLVIAGIDDLPLGGLEYTIFRREKLYLCVYKDHPFASRDSIYLEEAKKAGISPNASIECDYIMRGKLIEAGFGVAVTTGRSIDMNMLGNNVFIPLSDDFAERPIAIIWNPKHYLGKAARDFRDYTLKTETK